jgi:hypothetical protein
MTQTNAVPPSSDNILFNGTNINPTNPSQGAYSVVTCKLSIALISSPVTQE